VTAWPGLGRLTYDALMHRDLQLVAGCAAAGTALLAVGLLAADALIGWGEPRAQHPGARPGGGPARGPAARPPRLAGCSPGPLLRPCLRHILRRPDSSTRSTRPRRASGSSMPAGRFAPTIIPGG